MEGMERNVESVDKLIEKVEEPAAEFSRWRERGVGVIMLVSFIAVSLGGALVAFGKKIWAVMIGA